MVQVSIFPFLTYHLCLIFGKMDLGRKSCGYSLAYILFSLVLRFLWVRETNTYCIILGWIILRLVPVKNEKRKCKRILKLLFKNYVLSLNRKIFWFKIKNSNSIWIKIKYANPVCNEQIKFMFPTLNRVPHDFPREKDTLINNMGCLLKATWDH